MNLSFTLDTYGDVWRGDRDKRIHAAFIFAIWFAAGGYIVSTLGEYITIFSASYASFVGGAIIAALVPIFRFK
jgi:putative Mn2+ efflux pump MntP